MVKERLNELVDFATKESPYRSATKGWLNDDLFIQWGSDSQETSLNKGTELINFSVFWGPISKILSLVFSSLVVATSILCLIIFLSQGRLSIPFGTPLVNENISKDAIIQDLPEESDLSQAEISEKSLDPIDFPDESNDLEVMPAPEAPSPQQNSRKGLSLI